MKLYQECLLDSPLGELRLLASEKGLAGVYFPQHKNAPTRRSASAERHPVLVEAAAQLSDYFGGRRRSFELPLDPEGTLFQQRVWQALQGIPFGTTTSYGELARQLGSPQASRAVGRANGLNPLSIVVPCHRVVASNGKLTGFAGGLWAKEWLLTHEAQNAPSPAKSAPL